jgi:hypothetical protein
MLSLSSNLILRVVAVLVSLRTASTFKRNAMAGSSMLIRLLMPPYSRECEKLFTRTFN